MKGGDRNTKFFHAHASKRCKQNTILGLWDDHGRWCEEKDTIARAAVDYFENIYSTAFPTRVEDVEAIPTKVSEDMNESLTRVLLEKKWPRLSSKFTLPKPPGLTVCLLFSIRNIGVLLGIVSQKWS